MSKVPPADEDKDTQMFFFGHDTPMSKVLPADEDKDTQMFFIGHDTPMSKVPPADEDKDTQMFFFIGHDTPMSKVPPAVCLGDEDTQMFFIREDSPMVKAPPAVCLGDEEDRNEFESPTFKGPQTSFNRDGNHDEVETSSGEMDSESDGLFDTPRKVAESH